MKYLYLFGIVSLLSVTSFAQSKEFTAVSNAVEKLRKAMISGERAELEACASESLSYGHSSGMVENKAEFVEHIASGKSDFVTIDLRAALNAIGEITGETATEEIIHRIFHDFCIGK